MAADKIGVRNLSTKHDVLVQEVGVPNKNGLVYSQEVLENAVHLFQTRRHAYGVMHAVGNPALDGCVNLDAVSHKAENIRYVDGEGMMADITMLNTPMGKVLEKSLRDDVPGLHFRMRSFISQDKDGNVISCHPISIDVVNLGTDNEDGK